MDDPNRSDYLAESERYLSQARADGLLGEEEERELRAALTAALSEGRREPGSVLPRLLLGAEDTGCLSHESSPERAGARWALYEAIRRRTREQQADPPA